MLLHLIAGDKYIKWFLNAPLWAEDVEPGNIQVGAALSVCSGVVAVSAWAICNSGCWKVDRKRPDCLGTLFRCVVLATGCT
jgi:hypothetical protein